MVRPFGMVKDTSSVFYLNIQGIINQVLELTPRETVETYDREVARYLEPFQTVMITGSGATEGAQLYSVGTFIITLSTSTATE